MITVPYLLLFFVALGLQIAFCMKGSNKTNTAGHIVGALCGLYITFLIWLWAGFGESSRYRVFVVINGLPMYAGLWSILPALVFGFILTPLLSWLPLYLAYILTHFIHDGATTILPKTHLLTGFARGFCIFAIVIGYFAIGFLPFFSILDKVHYSQNFIAYLNNDFIHFSFFGLILAIWLLVGLRYIANIIASKLN